MNVNSVPLPKIMNYISPVIVFSWVKKEILLECIFQRLCKCRKKRNSENY